MKHIIYELFSYGDDYINGIKEISGASRFDNETDAIERINEARNSEWQEFIILKVYIGK